LQGVISPSSVKKKYRYAGCFRTKLLNKELFRIRILILCDECCGDEKGLIGGYKPPIFSVASACQSF
jgi:hypothetical protein